MEDNNFLIVVDTNKQNTQRIVTVSTAEDGSTITFGQSHLRQTILMVLVYIVLIPLLLICIWVSTEGYWSLMPAWFILILLLIYEVRTITRTITVDLKSERISVSGKWQKGYSILWSSYQGYEVLYTVKDIPETLWIKYQEGGQTKRLKLAELSPLLRSYSSSDFEALLTMWQAIEKEMEHPNRD